MNLLFRDRLKIFNLLFRDAGSMIDLSKMNNTVSGALYA